MIGKPHSSQTYLLLTLSSHAKSTSLSRAAQVKHMTCLHMSGKARSNIIMMYIPRIYSMSNAWTVTQEELISNYTSLINHSIRSSQLRGSEKKSKVYSLLRFPFILEKGYVLLSNHSKKVSKMAL